MPFSEAEGHIMMGDKREPAMNPAQLENPGMPENFMRENRETRWRSAVVRRTGWRRREATRPVCTPNDPDNRILECAA
jgi:hypothetical protein